MLKNVMNIDGRNAVIAYDDEIKMFRGEFFGLNGGADFYAKDVAGLAREGAISLKVFEEAGGVVPMSEVEELPEEDGGGFQILFPDYPGCGADGETAEEAVIEGQDALKAYMVALSELQKH